MYQKLVIVGNVGRDPDLRYTADGKANCTISVATNRNLGNGQKETTWFKVTAWEKMAEYINNYIKKGQKVLIEGRLYPDKTTGGPRVYTAKDGAPAASFEVVATSIQALDYVNNQEQQKPRQSSMMDDVAW